MKRSLERYIKALWIRACRYDGIDPSAKFCVFSDDNEFAKRHDKMVRMLMKGIEHGRTT